MIDEKAKEYCLTTCDFAKASLYRWKPGMNEHTERAISRTFYQMVFDTYPVKTGLSTEPGATTPDKRYTNDHYLSPQTIMKYIMDTELFNDYKKFEALFFECRKTIVVTRDQNNKLAQMTRKRPVLTKDKYDYLGYELYYGDEKLPKINQVLPVPEEFTKWEMKYIKNGFRATIVWLGYKSSLEPFMDKEFKK